MPDGDSGGADAGGWAAVSTGADGTCWPERTTGRPCHWSDADSGCGLWKSSAFRTGGCVCGAGDAAAEAGGDDPQQPRHDAAAAGGGGGKGGRGCAGPAHAARRCRCRRATATPTLLRTRRRGRRRATAARGGKVPDLWGPQKDLSRRGGALGGGLSARGGGRNGIPGSQKRRAKWKCRLGGGHFSARGGSETGFAGSQNADYLKGKSKAEIPLPRATWDPRDPGGGRVAAEGTRVSPEGA